MKRKSISPHISFILDAILEISKQYYFCLKKILIKKRVCDVKLHDCAFSAIHRVANLKCHAGVRKGNPDPPLVD